MRLAYLYRIFRAVIILVLLLGSTAQATTKAQAQQHSANADTPDCTALDMAFVIDQSKDLRRYDPHDIRIHAVKWLINMLGYDRLLSCPDTTHRVTVISFGGDTIEHDGKSSPVTVTSVDLDLTAIRPNIKESDPWKQWETEYGALTSPIKARNEPDRNFESLSAALDMAAGKLNEAPNEGSLPRKKAILLLMAGDGAPCSDSRKCAFYAIPGYQKGIKDLLSKKLKEVSLWVVLYGSGEDPYGFRPFWTEVTGTYSGKVFAPQTGDISTAKALLDIFYTLSPKPGLKEVCGSTYIDPAIERVTFTIFSQKPQSRINFQNGPDDIKTTPQAGVNQLVYTSDASKEPANNLEYVFKNPLPGNWEFDAACSNKQALVYMQVTRAQKIKVLAPLEKLPQYQENDQKYDPSNPYFLRLQVTDTNDQPVPEQAQYLGQGTGKVTLPNQTTYVLTFSPSPEGGYISDQPLPTSLTDQYTWTAEINLPHADPQQNESAGSSIRTSGTYAVAARLPFTIQLETPSSASVFPVHGMPWENQLKVKPLVIMARLKLRAGNSGAVPLTQAVQGDAKKAVRAVLYHMASRQQQEVWLEPSKTDPLLFVGSIGDQIEASGDYSLKVFFNGDYDKTNFRFVENEADARIEFARRDGFLQNPQNYQVLFNILSAAALAGLLAILYVKTNRVKGYLLFSAPIPGCPPFSEIDLGQFGRRVVKIKRERLVRGSRLLDNIDTILIKKDGLFGGRYTMQVVEQKTDLPVARTDEGELSTTTTKFYTVKYTPKPPSGE